jgi:uracil-DNA glycosylase
MLDFIEKSIGPGYNPEKDRVLRFLTTDLDTAKIVILGQDPYPEKSAATGRAFEVGSLKTWDTPFRQVSLKNFIRLIYISYNNINDYRLIPSFTYVMNEIKSGRFLIADPPELFSSLENQGVLFLNTGFTVIPGKPLSHREIWMPFTEKLIKYISQQKPDLNWFLWGKSAQALKPLILAGNFFECRHPMMCSQSYDDDFLKSRCIKDTMKTVDWTGIQILTQ